MSPVGMRTVRILPVACRMVCRVTIRKIRHFLRGTRLSRIFRMFPYQRNCRSLSLVPVYTIMGATNSKYIFVALVISLPRFFACISSGVKSDIPAFWQWDHLVERQIACPTPCHRRVLYRAVVLPVVLPTPVNACIGQPSLRIKSIASFPQWIVLLQPFPPWMLSLHLILECSMFDNYIEP
jgi:hypothetical protein